MNITLPLLLFAFATATALSSCTKSGNSGSTPFHGRIANADCGSLSKDDCSSIKNWYTERYNEGLASDQAVGGTQWASDVVGLSMSSSGGDRAFVELKDYCYKAKWTSEDCKKKIGEFMAGMKMAWDKENAERHSAEDKEKSAKDAEEKDKKAKGY